MDEVITPLHGPEMAPASGGKPKQLVILLHGLGSDGADLISLAPEFADTLPDAQFLSPNAPFPCDMAPFGYQWFSLLSYDPQAMLKGAELAAPILNHYIDAQLKRFRLKDENLAFIGFSQGTMMALYVTLRRPNACAGVLGYSGALLDANPTDKIVKSKPEICLVHGMADPVVPFMALGNAERGLKAAGVPVTIHGLPMLAHNIDHRCLEIGRKFLASVF
jgi:phospholipase/carboxylesterase